MDLLTVALTATLALAGVVLGHLLSARADTRSDRWRRREETMRMLRWAVELTSADENHGGIFGVTALEALLDSELLQPEDADMVERLASHARADVRGYTGGGRRDTKGFETDE